MDIQGLRKTTLLDFPGHVACTVFLGGCNFRCPFCHNFGLVSPTCPAMFSEAEFFEFLEKRSGLLDGVAVSGGEPCLRDELPEFLERIRRFGMAVKIDTNGSKPNMLAHLIEQELVDYVAMDIKAGRDRYGLVSGIDKFDIRSIEDSVKLIISSGIPHEFRTTVVGGLHTARDFEDIGEWIEDCDSYFLQQFVTADSVPDKNLVSPSIEDLEKYQKIAAQHIACVKIRGI